MDDLVQRAIRVMSSKKKTSTPWTADEPFRQAYYVYRADQQCWRPVVTGPKTTIVSSSIRSFVVYSWNIDFMLPFADRRMHAAIRHLESLVKKQPANMASVIYLQECLESDLHLLTADHWVQKTYNMTDISTTSWQNGHYGTCTLVDRQLPVLDTFRLHYSKTSMERDGLFVDVSLGPKKIRLCNTHLESLALDPPHRPGQMQQVATYMHASTIDGAIVGGDFNAIQDFDRTLHSDNGLRDVYLELGGSEDDAEAGHTWGQQAATVLRERFGTCRMDKFFFCGGLRCTSFDRFGADIEVEGEQGRRELLELGFDRPWITDHLGVAASFVLQE